MGSSPSTHAGRTSSAAPDRDKVKNIKSRRRYSQKSPFHKPYTKEQIDKKDAAQATFYIIKTINELNRVKKQAERRKEKFDKDHEKRQKRLDKKEARYKKHHRDTTKIDADRRK